MNKGNEHEATLKGAAVILRKVEIREFAATNPSWAAARQLEHKELQNLKSILMPDQPMTVEQIRENHNELRTQRQELYVALGDIKKGQERLSIAREWLPRKEATIKALDELSSPVNKIKSLLNSKDRQTKIDKLHKNLESANGFLKRVGINDRADLREQESQQEILNLPRIELMPVFLPLIRKLVNMIE